MSPTTPPTRDILSIMTGGDTCKSATTPALLTARDCAVAVTVLATCLAGDCVEICGINGNDDSSQLIGTGTNGCIVIVFVSIVVVVGFDCVRVVVLYCSPRVIDRLCLFVSSGAILCRSESRSYFFNQ